MRRLISQLGSQRRCSPVARFPQELEGTEDVLQELTTTATR
jgi:hypothetical protein